MATTQAVDAKYVNPFIAAAASAVMTLCGVETQRGVPYVQSPTHPRSYDLSGGVTLTGQITGLATINFTRPVICSLVTKMLDEPVTTIDQSVRDAVSKMATLMAETAKQQLQEADTELKVSSPLIIAGHYQSHNYPLGVPCIIVPFKIASGAFTIEVAVRAGK